MIVRYITIILQYILIKISDIYVYFLLFTLSCIDC